VLCTGIAYAIFYNTLQRIGAPRTATITYLIPAFGVMWAWLILGEPVTVTMAIACAMILGGVALSHRQPATTVLNLPRDRKAARPGDPAGPPDPGSG
jgi:drug/metabolite transporter (DMT)-like permease